jgi:hypothetical protein
MGTRTKKNGTQFSLSIREKVGHMANTCLGGQWNFTRSGENGKLEIRHLSM